MRERDAFGNMLLHFLAARDSAKMLVQALQTNLCDAIVNATNTGGQTFLHVVKRSEARRPGPMGQLLHAALGRGFDVCARDVYGRTILHVLRLAGLTWDALQRICPVSESWRCDRRDAFGLVPAQQAPPLYADSALAGPHATEGPSASADPAIAKEAGLLAKIRLAADNPLLEDVDRGNGLHCLAMATLSCASVVDKYRLESAAGGGGNDDGKLLDSSGARLEFRYELADGLLRAGVDPNQYDKSGATPLMAFAAQLPEDRDYKMGPKILELLIQREAAVHARNRAGEMALHVAVRRGRKLAVRTLVHHGASVHARDAEGRSVLDVADAELLGAAAATDAREYAHHEACRAWLSSSKGLAVQRPTVRDEWGKEAR